MPKQSKLKKTLKNNKNLVKTNAITKDQIESTFTKQPITIGLAYWKDCGHCQAMKPDWEIMNQRIRADDSLNSMVNFMEIEKDDHDAEEKLSTINADLIECNPIVINGYPTMFCKKENYVKQYNGGRSADELTEWVRTCALHGQHGGKKRKLTRRSNYKRRNKKNTLSFLKFW